MRLDGVAVLLLAARGRTGFNHIWVQGALDQERGLDASLLLQPLGKVVEDINESSTNCFPLLLWI